VKTLIGPQKAKKRPLSCQFEAPDREFCLGNKRNVIDNTLGKDIGTYSVFESALYINRFRQIESSLFVATYVQNGG